MTSAVSGCIGYFLYSCDKKTDKKKPSRDSLICLAAQTDSVHLDGEDIQQIKKHAFSNSWSHCICHQEAWGEQDRDEL